MKNLFKFSCLFIICFNFYNCSSSNDDMEITSMPEPEKEVVEEQATTTAIISIATEDSSSLNFNELVENNSSTKTLTIGNTGNSSLSITALTAPIGYTLDWTSGNIASGSSQIINVTFNPNEIADYTGDIVITSNATGGPNTISLIGHGVSSVYDGDVNFISQTELVDFAKIGYTSITGELRLGDSTFNDSEISDLTPLSNLVSVGTLHLVRNPLLEDLSGLENLDVTEILILLQNNALKNLDALSSITAIESTLQVGFNAELQNIDGLANITSAGTLAVNGNNLLENIDGLVGITQITSQLLIAENQFINNLDGLINLQSVGSNVSIHDNERLSSYCGIKPLLDIDGVQGNFYAMIFNRYNPHPTDIISGECEKDVPLGVYAGDLSITLPVTLDKFSSKEYEILDGDLYIDGRAELLIDSLKIETLHSILGNVEIRRTAISNLSGLSNITNIEGNILLRDNPHLADFCDITSLIQNSTGFNGVFTSQNNLYNPSQQDLEAGICNE